MLGQVGEHFSKLIPKFVIIDDVILLLASLFHANALLKFTDLIKLFSSQYENKKKQTPRKKVTRNTFNKF